MDVGLKLLFCKNSVRDFLVFQSLFWWMLVLNVFRHFVTPKIVKVSILVLMDVGLKPVTLEHICLSRQKFQSLFWWMLVLNGTAYTGFLVAFNWFQSLFWWMLVLNTQRFLFNKMEVKKFQSLFWWMLVLNRNNPGLILFSFRRFNPCFDGCWS